MVLIRHTVQSEYCVAFLLTLTLIMPLEDGCVAFLTDPY